MAKRQSRLNDPEKNLTVEGSVTEKQLILKLEWSDPMNRQTASALANTLAKFAVDMFSAHTGNGVRLVESKQQVFSPIKSKKKK